MVQTLLKLRNAKVQLLALSDVIKIQKKNSIFQFGNIIFSLIPFHPLVIHDEKKCTIPLLLYYFEIFGEISFSFFFVSQQEGPQKLLESLIFFFFLLHPLTFVLSQSKMRICFMFRCSSSRLLRS